MTAAAREPVRRRRVLAGTVVALAVVVGIVALAEGLRHPAPGVDPPAALDEDDGDPRVPADCPGPEPRDDDDRDPDAILGPVLDPVTVSSNQLLDCPRSYDGRTVRYQGEAVGGVFRRAEGAWVQLNDDVYADLVGPLPAHREYRGGNAGVGVFLPGDLADAITLVGGPQARGDLVEVVGVFHRVDPATREVTVVHAGSLEVVRTGEPFSDPPLRDRQVAAAVLAVLALAAAAGERGLARRRRRR